MSHNALVAFLWSETYRGNTIGREVAVEPKGRLGGIGTASVVIYRGRGRSKLAEGFNGVLFLDKRCGEDYG